MSAYRSRLYLCAALACLAGCQPSDPTIGDVTPRGGGSETTLVGRVLDDSGRAVAGAAIRIRDEEESPFDFGGIDSAAPGLPDAYSDAEGKYRIDGVHTGPRYLIECRRDAGGAAAVYTDADDEDTIHAPDAILRPTGVVRGRVRLPDSLANSMSWGAVYASIPGLWQKAVVKGDTTAFEITDVPAGTYALRLQPAYANMLVLLGILEIAGIKVEPSETTDVGELTLPRRGPTTDPEAYARDSAAVASFGGRWDSLPDVQDFSAVLGNRIILLYDLAGLLPRITDRVRELDALERIYLRYFREPADSLHPEGGPAKPLSPAISELSHLRSLRLTGMPASGYPRWTGTFPALTSLDLTEAGLDTIPAWILERKRLTYLALAANRLETIPATLSALNGLRELDLDGNRLRSIPPCLLRMKSLQGVNLRRNRICSATADEKAWMARQDSLWIRQQDPLESMPDSLSWEATQDCGTP